MISESLVRSVFLLSLLCLFLSFAPAAGQSPKHEVRAVWLATIGGIDWPRSTGAAAQREELRVMLDGLKRAGINTVLFQSRIRATTAYSSKLEPWDQCLTGTPGRSPGYDPLQLCIDLCHERGMECHAWVVTLPVGKWNAQGCKLLRQRFPKLIRHIGEEGYMDPEQAQTGEYLAQVCRELTRNYDIDGLHLDYIRYPETWRLRVSRQQGRDNITRIVRQIADAVRSEKPWVKLSCSPIGKHDDLRRYRSQGWNARTAVCQDAQQWLRLGLMDQLYPMIYFRGDQFFPFAIDWQENAAGRTVAGGMATWFLDPREGNWTADVVERQMSVLRQIGAGFCHFRAKFLLANHRGICDFTSRFCATPALVPPMTWRGVQPPAEPAGLTLRGGTLSWRGKADGEGGEYTLYNIYASEDYPVDISRSDNIVATRLRRTAVSVPAGSRLNYAVTAMDRYGQESTPAQLLVNAGPQLAPQPAIAITDGRPVRLPADATLDADYVVIETLAGRQVATRRYATQVSVADLPDGMYQLRSLGRKGRNHRIGFFCIKRKH